MKLKTIELSTIFLLLMLILIACKNDDPVPEPEVFTITIEIFTDTNYIVNDAEYVILSNRLDTNFYYPPLGFSITDILDTVVLMDSSYSLSIAYVGGWHNPEPYITPPPPIVDLAEGVILKYDTVYSTLEINLSYAIFQISDGISTVKDTAYYATNSEINDVANHFTLEYLDGYLNKLTYIFEWNGAMEQNQAQFEEYLLNYHKLPTLSSGVDLYMIDVFPYWMTPTERPNVTLFNKNF